MQVTITNATSGDLFVSFLYKSLAAGESLTVTNRSASELDQAMDLKALIAAGSVTTLFAKESVDEIVTGQGLPLASYADEPSLPAASSYPLYTMVWQADANAAVWTDGTNWRLASGVITT